MMKNKRRLIPIIAAGHFAVTATVLFAAFALFLNDNKGEELRAIRELLNQLGEILCFPLLPQNSGWLVARFGWYCIPVILIANSFLWAISLYGLGALFLKIKNKGKRPVPVH